MRSNKQPLVSVVTPAYNASLYIGEAANSILGQTYENIEYIIIDDNSTDNTWQIISEVAAKDPRVIIRKNDNNRGVAANRNIGIQLARGEFICWQDADDISLPDRIEKQVAYLVAHPKVGVVGGFIEFFGEGYKTSIRKYAEDDASLRKTIFRYNAVAQPAAMYRGECYKQVGMYDEQYVVDEDLEMLFRLGTKYQFANMQQLVLKYRQYKHSLTRSNLKLMELTAIKLRKTYAKDPAYSATTLDYFYNLAHRVSVYIIPSRFKVALFNLLRNS